MTSGVLSKVPAVWPVWNVHARVRFFTLPAFICVSVEKRVPPGSPPWYIQSRPGLGGLCTAGARCPTTPLCVASTAASANKIIEDFCIVLIPVT